MSFILFIIFNNLYYTAKEDENTPNELLWGVFCINCILAMPLEVYGWSVFLF
jgi:hypothetical protein